MFAKHAANCAKLLSVLIFSSDGGLPLDLVLVCHAQHKVDKLMLCDRDLDVLFLAHQLWEEDVAPKQPERSYWLKAALTILSSSARKAQTPIMIEPTVCPHVEIVQFGSSPIIKFGRSGRTHVVRLVRDCGGYISANSA